ncbi:MAG: hypothetical protein HY518_04640 [Candidatus Aenigmarchaeota archaeon]|nr:hypothetical protein [Candidatus Aenigmarchaeota archaeon]
MKEIIPGIFTWEYYDFTKRYFFNGFYLRDGQVFIDPPKMDPYETMEIARLGAPKVIILTNKDHVRETEHYRNYFKTNPRVMINELDKPHVNIKIDRTFQDGDRLPGNMKAVHITGNKSPGETALYFEKQKTILLGDALIGHPQGTLNLMPAEKYADVNKAKESLKILLNLDFKHVLVGDGTHVLEGWRKVLEGFLSR